MQNLKTVNQIVADTPALTYGGVRWDIFNSSNNGLAESGAIIRKGRRIYLDEDLYFKWLRKHASESTAAA